MDKHIPASSEEGGKKPFRPRSAKDVTERFGPEAANTWFAATRARRGGLERHMELHGVPPGYVHMTSDERLAKEEAERNAQLEFAFTITEETTQKTRGDLAKILVDKAREQYKEQQRILAMTFYPTLHGLKKLVESEAKYVGEIAELEGDDASGLKPGSSAADSLARRVLHVAAVRHALGGELTFNAVKQDLANDPRMIFDEAQLHYEYVRFVDILVHRGQLEADSPEKKA